MKKMTVFVGVATLVVCSGCGWFSKKDDGKKEGIKKEEVSKDGLVKQIKSEDHFKTEVMESKRPVVVKFGTKWCGVCKDMDPIYKKVAGKYKDKVKFTSVDADKLGNVAKVHGVTGVPTFIFFKDGDKVKVVEQGMEDDELEDHIEEVLE